MAEKKVRVRSKRLDQLDDPKSSLAISLIGEDLVQDETSPPPGDAGVNRSRTPVEEGRGSATHRPSTAAPCQVRRADIERHERCGGHSRSSQAGRAFGEPTGIGGALAQEWLRAAAGLTRSTPGAFVAPAAGSSYAARLTAGVWDVAPSGIAGSQSPCRSSGAGSRPLGHTTVRASSSTRTCRKYSGSRKGSPSIPRSKKAQLTSRTTPSLNATRRQ
jgi:hypothetical protein